MTRIALGEVQAFALGLALDVLDDDPDLGAAAAAVQAMVDPPIAEPEDLLLASRRSLVIASREDAEHVWSVCLFAANCSDDQIECRVGRGTHPEGIAHLREELRAIQRLADRALRAERPKEQTSQRGWSLLGR